MNEMNNKQNRNNKEREKVMKKNKEYRFYNTDTEQFHRFIPLFENNENVGEIMGVCLDSDKRNFDTDNNPIIQRGMMVKVSQSQHFKNKDGWIYHLKKGYNSSFEGRKHTKESHLDELYFGWNLNKDWKSYKESK